MSEFNIEALAEALYLATYPRLHQGAPPFRVWGDVSAWAQERWRDDARQLIAMYHATCVPVAQRTVTLRDVAPDLHAWLHGAAQAPAMEQREAGKNEDAAKPALAMRVVEATRFFRDCVPAEHRKAYEMARDALAALERLP